MVSILKRKINFFNQVIQHLSSRQIRSKVAGTLLDSTVNGGSGGSLLTLGKMASSLNITPEMVNKSLESLQEKGIIRMRRNRIIIINKRLLQKMAAYLE